MRTPDEDPVPPTPPTPPVPPAPPVDPDVEAARPKRQPRFIDYGGRRYVLAVHWRHVSGPIYEGPFYECKGQKHRGFYFTPDADFLHSSSPRKEPSFMHPVQQWDNEKMAEVNGTGSIAMPDDFLPPPSPRLPAAGAPQPGDDFA